jgi:hypothetical protein
MYPIDERDRVVELTDIPKAVADVPSPIVLADENGVVLSYVIEHGESGPNNVCFVRFYLVWTHLLGTPNDETLHGHPLWKRGLGFYGAFRVDDSSLVRRLVATNSVHKRHDDSMLDDLKHYIFTFHDSTFECVARSYETAIARTTCDEWHGKALELLQRKPPSDLFRSIKTDPVSRLH